MAQGSTRASRAARASVLARDRAQGWKCRAHEEGWCARELAPPHSCEGVMQHAHHVHGKAVTGNDQRYLVGSCETCNLKIGEPGRRGGGDPPATPVTRW